MSNEESIKHNFYDRWKNHMEELPKNCNNNLKNENELNNYLTTSEISVEDSVINNMKESVEEIVDSTRIPNYSKNKNLVSKKDYLKKKKVDRLFPFHYTNHYKENKNLFKNREHKRVAKQIDLFSTSPFSSHQEPSIQCLKNENEILSYENKFKKPNEYFTELKTYELFKARKTLEETTIDVENISVTEVSKQENINTSTKLREENLKEELDILVSIQTDDQMIETFQNDQSTEEPLNISKEEFSQQTNETNKDTSNHTNVYKEDESICRLCLMEFSKPLQGLYPRTLFTLECGHTFHFKCIFETLKRRDCRKQCSICYTEYSNLDKQTIFRQSKSFIKKIEKNNEALYHALLNNT